MDYHRGMKSQPEMTEGPQAWKNFDKAIGKLLSVPHAELVRREEEYRKQAAQKANRPGPRRKSKRSSR